MYYAKAPALLILAASLSACSETGPSSNGTTEPTEQQIQSNVDSDETQADVTQSTDENVSNQPGEPALAESTESNLDETDEPVLTESDTNEDAVTPVQSDDTTLDSGTEETTTEVGPAEPIGLKGVVYTDTEIELFWDRGTDTSIINYTVSRDAVALTTVDALSYYDNTVVPGTTYEYTLQSVNSNGTHSDPISLFLTTPVKAPTINATNARQLLQQAASVTNGRVFGRELGYIYTTVFDGKQEKLVESGFVLESTDYDGSTTRLYGCDQTGQFTISSNQSSLPSYVSEFTDCASALFDNESINGKYSLRQELSKYVYNSGRHSGLRIDDLVTTDTNNKHRTLNGLFSSFSGPIRQRRFVSYEKTIFDSEGKPELDDNGDAQRLFIPFNYVSQAFEGETRVNITKIERSRGALQNTENSDLSDEWKHALSAEFTLQSPGTGNKLISITTPEPLVTNTIGECFEQGQLKLTAADGSELLLDANNGNAKTATLHVTADGVMSEETIDWNSELLLFHANPDDVYGFRAQPLDNLPDPEDCTDG